jgi:hypothetical protein
MDDDKTVNRVKEDPAAAQVPGAAVIPENVVEDGKEEEKEKEKEPKIDIKQVPMDGVCGGY